MRKLKVNAVSRVRGLKIGVTVAAALMLSTCTPSPSVIDQIKTLGELRVVTRISPLAYYLDADDIPEGPEYDLARRFADELGVKLKITPVHSYAEIYGALTTGRGPTTGGGGGGGAGAMNAGGAVDNAGMAAVGSAEVVSTLVGVSLD